MSKRLIGVDIGARTLRTAIFNKAKKDLTVNSLEKREFQTQEELLANLQELLSGKINIGDHVVVNLPFHSAYVRKLTFPFKDKAKISAAIPFELGAQLPVAIESCEISTQQIELSEDGSTVMAAAAPAQAIESLLEVFEAADVPLHRIDLAPFCHVASFGQMVGNGILICFSDHDIIISLLKEGHLVDYRVLPTVLSQGDESSVQRLVKEIKVLCHAAGLDAPEMNLMGGEDAPALAALLRTAGMHVNILSLDLMGQTVDAHFLPAAALALGAESNRAGQSFNFRSGRYRLKGEWANLKGKLVFLAALLGCSVLIMLGAMTLSYLDKARQADHLQEKMVSIYRTLFPTATTIVDVPLQLKSAIKALQVENTLVSSSQPSALEVLKEISGLSQQFDFEIEEYTMATEELKLTGHSASFETVNQIAKQLEKSSLFATAQVADAKMSLDGNKVDFRVLLTFERQVEAE